MGSKFVAIKPNGNLIHTYTKTHTRSCESWNNSKVCPPPPPVNASWSKATKSESKNDYPFIPYRDIRCTSTGLISFNGWNSVGTRLICPTIWFPLVKCKRESFTSSQNPKHSSLKWVTSYRTNHSAFRNSGSTDYPIRVDWGRGNVVALLWSNQGWVVSQIPISDP